MINVFVKRGFSYTWNPYLHEWGGARDHEFVLHDYEGLADLYELRAGPVIFADIERLTSIDRALAGDVARVIATERPDVPILNSPTTTLRRYDLLSELYRRDLNPFRAYRLTDTTMPERFPVFLRYENDHAGTQSGILRNQRELDRAIVRLKIRRHDLRQLIMVEFVDTRDSHGNYVKYGAFKVGDAIVPKHAFSHTSWVVKGEGASDTPGAGTYSLAYVRENPHESILHQRFDAGAVDYGRIDYSMLGDSLVTWEINTNPTILLAKDKEPSTGISRMKLFLPRFSAALDAVEPNGLDPAPISLADVCGELRSASRAQCPSRPSTALSLGRKYKRLLEPAVRATEILSVPFEGRILARWRRRNGI